MADRAEITLSEDVTPAQFFEQLLPLGFAAQAEAGAPDATLAYRLTGAGGGEWTVRIAGGAMSVTPGAAAAAQLAFTLSVDDWRDAVLGRNGATLALILPQGRQARPEAGARALQLKGTLAQELSREGAEPFRVELCFNGAAAPRTLIRMKLQDYLDMQAGKLNGQELFMTGRLRVEGDLPFLMQIAALTL
jgi:hypothetical protein